MGKLGKHAESAVPALTRCLEFARDFNADIELRIQLWSQGFMKKVPNLLKQAGNGIACALRVLFRLYTSDRDGADAGTGGEAGQALPPEEVETMRVAVPPVSRTSTTLTLNKDVKKPGGSAGRSSERASDGPTETHAF